MHLFIAGIFYFTLGNVPPEFRSKLSSIYLVSIAKNKHLQEYGIDEILKPFIRDVTLLASFHSLINCHLLQEHTYFLQEKGHIFHVKGAHKVLYGTLAAVSADNLGALALGGFKESCSAYRPCRHCMCTQDSARTKVNNENDAGRIVVV